jgi:hypothetical protein
VFCVRALFGKIWFSQACSFFSFGLAVAKVLKILIWFSRPALVGFVPVVWICSPRACGGVVVFLDLNLRFDFSVVGYASCRRIRCSSISTRAKVYRPRFVFAADFVLMEFFVGKGHRP